MTTGHSPAAAPEALQPRGDRSDAGAPPGLIGRARSRSIAALTKRTFWLWPALSFLATAAAGFVVFTDVSSPARLPVVLAFLLLFPGMALVRLLGLADGLAELTLSVAVSIALAGILSGAMLYAGAWSPEGALAVLMAITALATLFEIMRPRSNRYERVGRR